jgi:kynureninase
VPDALAREHAEQLDADDPLAALAYEFVVDDDALIYLDGNSLGRLPHRTRQRLRTMIEREWGSGLVRSWSSWVGEPIRVGDRLGDVLLGVGPGQVLIADNTTVNLYKIVAAAIDEVRAREPGRTRIVTDSGNFPTDRYVLEGLAASRSMTLDLVHLPELEPITADSLAPYLDDTVAVLSLSLVDYRSAAIADLAGIQAAADAVGAHVVWDLSHAVGAIPLDLDAAGATLAVGCTYKYVNAGPGAPAFMYVRADLQERLRQPIWGWFGQTDQFAMGHGYTPAEGISRFATGTPPMLGLAAVAEGVDLLAEAGMAALRDKSILLTEQVITLHDAWLEPLGFALASPRDPAIRAGHVSLAHPEAYQACQALIAADVVPDFRAPDRLRLGLAPATTSHTQVWDAMERLRAIVASGDHLTYPAERATVT